MNFLKNLLFTSILILFFSCKNQILMPDIISVDNIKLNNLNDDFTEIDADIKFLNKNDFKIKYNEIKIDLFTNEKLILKILKKEKKSIKKNSIDTVRLSFSIDINNLDENIIGDDNLALKATGYIKKGIFKIPIRNKFNLSVRNILNNFFEENFSKEFIQLENIALTEINGLTANLKIEFILINNFDFPFIIKDLNSLVYKDTNKNKILAYSNAKNEILIKKKSKSPVYIDLNINLLSLDPSLLLGVLKNDLHLFLDTKFKIEINNKKIPVYLTNKVIINTKNFEVSIE